MRYPKPTLCQARAARGGIVTHLARGRSSEDCNGSSIVVCRLRECD